ncbi:2-keto-4-pentenoate hydratase [Prauserella flavalba]|uniref:2-keto-4-pentenoate hydratase n=1 Tax=Prauserella flavalba TaxID=1477506 RepID=UPI0036ECC342
MTVASGELTQQAGKQLWTARETARAVPPVRHLFADGDAGAGYAVQELLTLRRLRDGARVIGRKIGLTSPAVQRQLGVDQPDFGILFHDMLHKGPEAIERSRLIQPRIEGEVAFMLGEDLDDAVLDAEVIRRKTAYVQPALEVVDSRVQDWDISIVDTVADNASSGLFVLGEQKTTLDAIDLAAVRMELRCAGEVVSSGTGADCLGDPVTAVLWLARTFQSLGRVLRAGEVILSGALGPMVEVRPGGEYHATITGLGDVSARFDTGAPS